MFGISFTELVVILLVALVVLGPQKLPVIMRTVGSWVGRLRRLTSEIRAQTGIDDLLRREGIEGGVGELRQLLRGDMKSWAHRQPTPSSHTVDPYRDSFEFDTSRERPIEGPDVGGAIAEDIWADPHPVSSPED